MLGWTGVATPVEMERWPDLPLGALVGRAGLEQVYDPILRGTDGRQCVYVTPAGTPVGARPLHPAPARAAPCGSPSTWACSAGSPERSPPCCAACRDSPAVTSAGAVVLDPRNGQVLAMASLPSYDNRVFGPPGAQPGAWRGWRAARRARCSST